VGGRVGRCPGQPLVPGPQRFRHPLSRRLQVGDLLIDRLEHPLCGRAHFAARFPSRFAHPQKPGDLAEREPELLRASNHVETMDDGVRVQAIAGRRPERFRQQSEPLVIPNRVSADLGERGDFADREELAHGSIIAAA